MKLQKLQTFGMSLILVTSVASAQNLLPNPGFEVGDAQPAGWKLSGTGGKWSTSAHHGNRALMVEGNGKNSSFWRTENLQLQPHGLYRLSFFAKREAGASGGCAIAGISRVNRDFTLSDSWQRYSFVFSVPDDGTNDYVRLGHWECKGQLFFDDVELNPVQVSTRPWTKWGAIQQDFLGAAEKIEQGIFRFQPDFGWVGANYSYPLYRMRTTFNSDRWVFSPGSEIIYRFGVEFPEKSARLSVGSGYYISGKLSIEASQDAKTWKLVTRLDGKQRSVSTNLPPELFPAKQMYVRLSMSGPDGNLQVNSLSYEAPLEGTSASVKGETQFMDVLQSSPNCPVQLRALGTDPAKREVQALFAVSKSPGAAFPLSAGVDTDQFSKKISWLGDLKDGLFTLKGAIPGIGEHVFYWKVNDNAGKTVFLGRSEAKLGFLYDSRPGYHVARTNNMDIWWCESGWKIGRQLKPPPHEANTPPKPVRIAAARGEYEPVQVMLHSLITQDALTSAQAGAFTDSSSTTASISVQLNEVAYVHVNRPTDSTCEPDYYPDPLPPLTFPHALVPGENNPIWVTFYIPRETKAGDYTSELKLQTKTGTSSIPLAVHVYDFELPRETHLRSALGLGSHEINRYHRLTKAEDKQAVYEKYLQNFAEHRISPYSFFDYAPIDIRFTGPRSNRQAKVDFTKFDAAATKWLDEYKFNSFQLPLHGMGGGTFQSRALGSLEGFKEGTPEFARLFKDYLSQIEAHLKERGWLNKAYTYWFDEPDRKDYEFVVDGMKRIKAAAPGLKRLLTEQPEPELSGHVEIWCGLTPEWTREKVAQRRQAGERVWWYICCGPKAPYVTEFIDHPGTELRLWPWQSWQYGVEGILIWATTYWTSSSAFPGGKMQDPWADPMSYVSGYDFGPGHIGYWGNGDGRFLYPPRRVPGTNQPPCLDAPISSVRWENLRDGMEDYEYFWLLQKAVEKAGENDLTREARALLALPENISKDLTHFTSDPRMMLEHRERVAKMIEKLKGR